MTIRSPEIEQKLLEELMSGKSMRQVCDMEGMPHRMTVIRWMAEDKEFATKCARAREIQADTIEEDMADIEDEVLQGRIDPAAARVVLSSKQWRASKMAPKKYGDKVTLAGDKENPLQVEQTLDVSKLSTAALTEILAAKNETNNG